MFLLLRVVLAETEASARLKRGVLLRLATKERILRVVVVIVGHIDDRCAKETLAGWHSNATAKTLVSLQDRGQLVHDISNSASLASFTVTILREIELVTDRVRAMVSSRHLDH